MCIAGCGSAAHAGRVEAMVVERAADVSAATGLKMNISLDETVGGPSINFTASGSFSPKTDAGSMMMNMQVPSSGGPAAPMRIVIEGGTIYERLPSELASQIPGGKPWLSVQVSQLGTLSQMPGLDSFIRESLIFANPQQYLDFLAAAAAGSAKKIGQASVGGLRTTQYQTTINIAKLPAATPSVDRQAAQQLASVSRNRIHASAVPVDVWIDRASLIRQLQTTVRGTLAGHVVSISITEDITHYGAQPVSTTPNPANTTDLLSLVQGLAPSSG